MTLYIHVGIGKTGTTAIQDSLYANRAALEGVGIVYPEFGVRGTGHHDLCPLDYKGGDSVVDQAWLNIRDDIVSRPSYKFVISSEFLIYVTPEHFKQISSILNDLSVKVIFYIREQVELIESTYLQWQKNSADYVVGLENFWWQNRSEFDYGRLVSPWAEAFGRENIIVRLFDKRVIGSDVCADFYNIIGARLSVGSFSSSNDSILPEFSRLIEKLDRLAINDFERRLIINEILICSRIFKNASCTSLVSALQEKIYEYYRCSNVNFARTYMDDVQAAFLLEGGGARGRVISSFRNDSILE